MELASLNPLRFYREAFWAITDFTFYRFVFQQKLYRTFAYLLLLVVNAALVETLIYGWTVLPSMERFFEWSEGNFPPLEFKDGKLSVDAEQPLVREYFSDRIRTFLFDTTGSPEALYKYDQPVYALTRDNFRILADGNPQTYRWDQLLQVAGPFLGSPREVRRIDSRDWADWRRMLPMAFYPMTFLFLLFKLSLTEPLQAMLLTFFGMSASMRLGVRLPFSHYFSIAIYSLTPAVAIHLIVAATGQYVFYYDLICLATAAIYAYKATQKCVVIE